MLDCMYQDSPPIATQAKKTVPDPTAARRFQSGARISSESDPRPAEAGLRNVGMKKVQMNEVFAGT